MTTNPNASPLLALADRKVCANCFYVQTFKPRADEQERYGFTTVGFGCGFPNYEGYTDADGSCSAFRAQASETGRG